jgi:RimJ/RimL family protein N-acetyltransferase
MTTAMPVLETERLIIRTFVPDDVERIGIINEESAVAFNHQYVHGTIAFGQHLAALYQPPYGDRAVDLKAERRMIAVVGLVPCLMPFEQLDYFTKGARPHAVVRSTAEVGMYWACDPAYRRQGYAAEAARAIVEYAFRHMNLKRIVATTEYDNIESQGVMRKLGMTLERNPLPEPHYMQVVGILENPLESA